MKINFYKGLKKTNFFNPIPFFSYCTKSNSTNLNHTNNSKNEFKENLSIKNKTPNNKTKEKVVKEIPVGKKENLERLKKIVSRSDMNDKISEDNQKIKSMVDKGKIHEDKKLAYLYEKGKGL